MRQVYLDYNATTPVHPEVLEVLIESLREDFGNPSSVHRYGRRARVAIDDARDAVADMLGAPAASIVFSSGGTEANNTILKGVAAARREHGCHLVTSQIEHPAVLDTCAALAQQGYEITYVPVDDQGIVDPQAVRDALTDKTILVSIMYANNISNEYMIDINNIHIPYDKMACVENFCHITDTSYFENNITVTQES